jgi:type I restriction enzyme S subunit
MANLITDHIDIWTAAQTQKTNGGRGRGNGSAKQISHGIKKLRELILELAVRGKLVPQDPKDEPASVLLEKIAKKKARLIKKQKSFPEITEAEKQYKLPKNWKWVRLGEIGVWAIGSGFPKKEQGCESLGILFSKVSDMNLDGNEKYIYTTINTISEETASKLKINVHSKGTVIFPKIGGAIATNKRRILVKPTAIDNNCLGITPMPGFDTEYLHLYLSSLDLIKYQVGTSVPALSQGTLELILLGLPPTAEQHRIVAKVDELMNLCEQLEQKQTDSNATYQTLVETLLASLTSATDQDEFTEAWERIAEHFDTLFTTEHSIDKLKQTILQLAVMGKLVPQDPKDEPASVLLEKIAKEKTQLIKEGKIKKQAPLSEISEDKKPFKLPGGWEWVRLQQIIQISSGDGLIAADMNNDGGIPVFGGNGITGYHDQANVTKPTLVIGRVGNYCGSIHITPASAWVTDNAFITMFSENNIYINFLFWLLKGTNLKENENATAQPVISGRKVYPIVVGLPPTAEQHRIVAKVDKLMAICNTLKARLNDAQTTQIQLADAIVEQAVA